MNKCRVTLYTMNPLLKSIQVHNQMLKKMLVADAQLADLQKLLMKLGIAQVSFLWEHNAVVGAQIQLIFHFSK